jgi:methionyl-tRNA synthetase
MNEAHKIDGVPCVEIIIEFNHKRGSVYLSSFYGSYTIDSELVCPPGEVPKFFCPHCNSELTSKRKCEKCDAPMVWIDFLEGYGRVQICSRRGCKHHLIEFEDIEYELRKFFEIYGNI